MSPSPLQRGYSGGSASPAQTLSIRSKNYRTKKFEYSRWSGYQSPASTRGAVLCQRAPVVEHAGFPDRVDSVNLREPRGSNIGLSRSHRISTGDDGTRMLCTYFGWRWKSSVSVEGAILCQSHSGGWASGLPDLQGYAGEC